MYSSIRPSVHPIHCMPNHASIPPSIHPFIHPSMHSFSHLSMHQPNALPICAPDHASVHCVHPFKHPSSIHASIHACRCCCLLLTLGCLSVHSLPLSYFWHTLFLPTLQSSYQGIPHLAAGWVIRHLFSATPQRCNPCQLPLPRSQI